MLALTNSGGGRYQQLSERLIGVYLMIMTSLYVTVTRAPNPIPTLYLGSEEYILQIPFRAPYLNPYSVVTIPNFILAISKPDSCSASTRHRITQLQDAQPVDPGTAGHAETT